MTLITRGPGVSCWIQATDGGPQDSEGRGSSMAIGVKVDPRVIVSGNVVAVAERRAFVSKEDRDRGVVGDVERHDVLLSQGDGGQLQVRFRVRDGIPLPQAGDFVAIEARVSEGSFRDDDGNERGFVSLVAIGPADDALDRIHSALAGGK